MQTATNPAFAAYQDMLLQSSEGRDPNTIQTDNTNHYIFYAGEDIPYPHLALGKVQRGRVTPVLPFPLWDKFEGVPQGLQVRVRGQQWINSESVPEEAQYILQPDPLFRHIMENYGDWGIVELEALRGMSPAQVIALNIDDTFFPKGVPATYTLMKERILETAAEVKSSPNYPVYRQIAQDMLKGIDGCIRYDNARVDEVEGNIERSKSNPAYQSTYCAMSIRMLARLERGRKDEALIRSVASRDDAMKLIPELLKGIKDQAANANTGISASDLVAAVKEIVAAEKKEPAAKAAKAKVSEDK